MWLVSLNTAMKSFQFEGFYTKLQTGPESNVLLLCLQNHRIFRGVGFPHLCMYCPQQQTQVSKVLRWVNRQAKERVVDEWVGGWMDGWMDGWNDEKMDKQLDGWVDRWIE